MVDFAKGDRLIPAKERKKIIPFSDAHWDRLERAGKVPKRYRIGEHRVAWSLNELQDYADKCERGQPPAEKCEEEEAPAQG